MDWLPDWKGQTVVIVASGPSAGDVKLSHAIGKARFVAINESWRLAPWAELLYGADAEWWETRKGVPEFKGLRASQDVNACRLPFGIKHVPVDFNQLGFAFDKLGTIGWSSNSGAQVLNLVAQLQPKVIVLVGFDMTLKWGSHWHGDHPRINPTHFSIAGWRNSINKFGPKILARGVEIINCSQVSTLTVFPKLPFDAIFPPEARPRLALKPEGSTYGRVKDH
jgi:hypothetical protein